MDIGPSDLVGRWRLARVVEDRAGAETLRVEGTLDLEQVSADELAWHEHGSLWRSTRPADQAVVVRRRLGVVRRDAGWMVVFEDGRDFHPWSPGADVVHPCGSDTYRGRVDLLAADRWRVTWTVTGPAKDYTMVTDLSVLDGPAAPR